MPTDPAATRPWYFISYAHDSGNDDECVRRFHADLSHDVRLYSGRSDPDIGFCDVLLRAGDQWSPALVEALCTCQVFLALCSPRYFESLACGKEWAIFSRRMTTALPAGPHRPPCLIPLLWVPMDMPAVAAEYQYRDATFGVSYDAQGLRDLIRLRDNHDAYCRFVDALAKRVVELCGRYEIPSELSRPAFDEVDPAFPRPGKGRRAPGSPRSPRGPKHLRGPGRQPQPPAHPSRMPRLNPNPPDEVGGDPR